MTTSDLRALSFAALKMKLKRLINDLMNDLGYLHVRY